VEGQRKLMDLIIRSTLVETLRVSYCGLVKHALRSTEWTYTPTEWALTVAETCNIDEVDDTKPMFISIRGIGIDRPDELFARQHDFTIVNRFDTTKGSAASGAHVLVGHDEIYHLHRYKLPDSTVVIYPYKEYMIMPDSRQRQ